MTFASALTPVFVAVLCVVIAFVVRSLQNTETTSNPQQSHKKVDSRSTTEARPWVDQDLQDNTEITSKDNGTVCVHPESFLVAYYVI